MGMTYLDYARCTWAQFVLKCEGYENRQLREDRRNRLLSWLIYISIPKKEGTVDLGIYEWMPLPNDPTKAQILVAEKRAEKKKVSELDRESKSMLAKFEKLGIIQNGRVVSEVP